MSFFSSFGEHKGRRPFSQLTGVQPREPRTRRENSGINTGREIEHEQDNFFSKRQWTINQQLAEVNSGITSINNKLDAEHQPCGQAQATSDLLKQSIREAFEEYLPKYMDPTQPPSQDLRTQDQCPAATPQSQLAADSVDPNYKGLVAELTLKLERSDSELKRVKGLLRVAESRADQLRNIIIPREVETILDSQIQRLFCEVRSLTQLIVSRLYIKPEKYWETTSGDSGDFFKDIRGLSTKLQRDAIHAEFSFHLGTKYFCVMFKGFGLGKDYQKLGKLLTDTEHVLMSASRSQDRTGSLDKEVKEWRHASFKCVDRYRGQCDEQSSEAIRFFEEYFKPALTDDERLQHRGKKHLKVLCDKAHDLGVLMRRAEDAFEYIDAWRTNVFADCEDEVEEIRCNGERVSGGVKVIDSCFFGGLRKVSKERPSQSIMLERAHVSTKFSSPAC